MVGWWGFAKASNKQFIAKLPMNFKSCLRCRDNHEGPLEPSHPHWGSSVYVYTRPALCVHMMHSEYWSPLSIPQTAELLFCRLKWYIIATESKNVFWRRQAASLVIPALALESIWGWESFNGTIVTCSHSFSRASRQLHVITLSFDWFTVFSLSFVIG